MEAGKNSFFKGIFGFTVIVLSALFFSACVLQTSGNTVWIVLIISLLLGILSIWIPAIIVVSFIIATIVISNEILPVLSGTSELHGFGIIKLHPAGITLFTGSFIHIIMKKNILLERIRASRTLSITFILFSLFTISIFTQTLPLGGFKGIPHCLENYVFPFCFFLYLLTLNPENMSKILKYFVFFIVLIALYGLFEYLYGLNFLYNQFYSKSTYAWYHRFLSRGYRITTFIGHPLKNALYFLFAVPVAVFIYRKPLNFISSAILILAVFVTGSRIAFLLAISVILVCYLSIRFNIYEYYKSILITIAVLSITYLILYHSVLGTTLLRRFYEGHDSALIRIYSLENTPRLIMNNFLLGKGMGLSFRLSASFLRAEKMGFENPWIMLIADVGFITAVSYLVIILLTAVTKLTCLAYKGINRGIYLSFLSVLLMMSSFNSFGSRNTLNFLLWFNIALLYTLASKQEHL